MSQNYDFFLNSKKDNNDNEIGNNKKLSMKNFFEKPFFILNRSSNIENKENKEKNIKKEDFEKMEREIIPSNNENHFTLLNLLNEQQMQTVNNYYKENYNLKFENPLKITNIKIDDKNKNIYNIMEILRYPNKFIKLLKSKKKCIFSGNFFQYLMYKNKFDMIPKLKDNLPTNVISKCKFYLESNNIKDFILELSKIIEINDEKKILDLKNDEGQNIFHILAMSSKFEGKELESIYDKLSKFKIDNSIINESKLLSSKCKCLYNSFNGHSLFFVSKNNWSLIFEFILSPKI